MISHYSQSQSTDKETQTFTQPIYQLVPEELRFLPALAGIRCIKVKNFRSFHQQKYIGPFTQFTSVIGVNGSGKSNILEAIMFCLIGDKLKGEFYDLAENYYRPENKTAKEAQAEGFSYWVEIVFNYKVMVPAKLRIRREIVQGREQHLHVNNIALPREGYAAFLQLKGIIMNQISNLAVTQNSVDSLLYKEPALLRQELDIYAGTFPISQQIRQLIKKSADVNEVIQNEREVTSKYKQEKKEISFARNAGLAFKQLCDKIDEVKFKVISAKMVQKQIEIEWLEKEVEAEQAEEKDKMEEMKNRKRQAQENFVKSIELKKEIEALNMEIAEIQKEIRGLDDESLLLKERKVRELGKKWQEEKQELETYEAKKRGILNKMPEIQSSSVLAQYLDVYLEWQKSNWFAKTQFQSKQSHLASLTRSIEDTLSALDKLRQEKKKFDYDKGFLSRKIKEEKQNLKQVEKNLRHLEEEYQKYLREYAELPERVKVHEAELAENNEIIRKLRNKIQQGIFNNESNVVLHKLEEIEGCYGDLGSKIKPSLAKYSKPIKNMFQSISRYILVENQEASVEIGLKLKQLGKTRNIIILKNAKNHEFDLTALKNELKSETGIPAIEALTIDHTVPNLRNFISHYLKRQVIVESIDAAFSLRSAMLESVTEIYTEDGELVQAGGMIVSNGYEDEKQYDKFDHDVEKNLKKEIAKYEAISEKISNKIIALGQDYNHERKYKKRDLVEEAEKNKSKIQSEIEKLGNYQPDLKRQEDIKKYEAELQELYERREEIEKTVRVTEKQIEETEECRRFMKKHKIESLDSFRNVNNIDELQKKYKYRTALQKQLLKIETQLDRLKQSSVRQKFQEAQKQLQNIRNNSHKKQLRAQIKQKTAEIVSKKEEIQSLVTECTDVFVSKVKDKKQKLGKLQIKFETALQQLNSQYESSFKQFDINLVTTGIEIQYQNLTPQRLGHYIEKLQKQLTSLTDQKQKLISFSLNSDKIENEEEQFRVVNEKIALGLQRIATLSREKQQLQSQLEVRKEQHKRQFYDFFQRFRINLKNIYELLTDNRNVPHASKGKINIFLQEHSFPWRGELFFIPIPPFKRLVYDIEQLSGAEKSMACISYHFAVAMTTRAPFILLDEIDVNLDEGNVKRLSRLFEKAKRNVDMQVLLVTHNMKLLESCNSLIGVRSDQKAKTSRTYSLRLD